MRRAGTVRPELHQVPAHRLLELKPEELPAAVSLDALDGKRKLIPHPLFKKPDAVLGSPAGVDAKHTKSCAIINGRVLVDAWCDLACIHLDALSRYGSAVSHRLGGTSMAAQRGNAVTVKNPPDRGRRDAPVVMPQ